MLDELGKAVVELTKEISHVVISAQEKDSGYVHWIKFAGLTASFVGATFYAYYWGMKAFREKIHQLLIDPDTFWSKPSVRKVIKAYRDQVRRTIPVLVVANYKGGVGKSMISANLAAYFDKIGFRVLLIDYDYQGSLTDYVPYRDTELTFSANYILEGRRGDEITRPHKLGKSFQRSSIHPAQASLNQIDNQLIYNWLSGARKEDIRFNTHKYLGSTYVQQNFDIVIIDTPPRICAATANALCAATHVIMPTILDTVSSRTVLSSLRMFLDFRNRLNLSFKIIGVVPSKVEAKTRYNNRESKALEYLEELLLHNYGSTVNLATMTAEPIRLLKSFPIMQKAALLHVEGDDLVIFNENPTPNDAVVLEMFSSLGNHVLEKMGLKEKTSTDGELDANKRVTGSVVELKTAAGATAG